jgi:hypothetical protein
MQHLVFGVDRVVVNVGFVGVAHVVGELAEVMEVEAVVVSVLEGSYDGF